MLVLRGVVVWVSCGVVCANSTLHIHSRSVPSKITPFVSVCKNSSATHTVRVVLFP
eukprot:m.174277 g.174277  ORF g.174277 m.174277 type:complete len:56 (+) comp53298_c3_seq1:2804-2971(+)